MTKPSTNNNLSKKFLRIFATISIVPLILVITFFVTKKSVSSAELAFVEHSVLGKEYGAVIPASCSSSPPTDHFPHDCEVNVQLKFGAIDFVGVNFTSDNTVFGRSGEMGYLRWTSSGATSCSASGAWNSGGPGATNGVYPVFWNGDAYTMRESIYYLTCTNGVRSITKGVRIFSLADICYNGGCGN